MIAAVIPDAILEIRYYSTFNFVSERIKIYDAYSPQTAVEHYKARAEDLEAIQMKPYFYLEVDKSELFDKVPVNMPEV